jgi:hypothetical protein
VIKQADGFARCPLGNLHEFIDGSVFLALGDRERGRLDANADLDESMC